MTAQVEHKVNDNGVSLYRALCSDESCAGKWEFEDGLSVWEVNWDLDRTYVEELAADHNQDYHPDETTASAPQTSARARAVEKAGDLAKALIDAANTAASHQITHAQAIANPVAYRESMFAIAQARRQADTQATEALHRYIAAAVAVHDTEE